MIRKVKIAVSVLVLLVVHQLSGQTTFTFTPGEVQSRLKEDVYTLSSEEMEGREAGTEGERKAAAWIMQRMQEAGLQPVFEGSFLQEFTFPGPLTFGSENKLIVAEEEYTMGEDYFVLPNSANGKIQARAVYVGFGLEEELHSDYEGLEELDNHIFFMEYYLPSFMDDGAERQPLAILQRKIELARQKGALAVILINTQSERTDPPTSLNQRLGKESIPVLFARAEIFEHWQQMASERPVIISAELIRDTITAVNVAGYIDNDAENTVVLGGHYDHLGYGGQGSRSPGVNAIHYGADDNASGVAGVLEAARYFSQGEYTGHNYLFIAFSAEERGLIGSRYFTESEAYPMERVSYMLNYDMIGRMENRSFTTFGTGTSPVWVSTIDSVANDSLNIRKSSSGQGGSDHSSFYRVNIPALFFFTGIHEDYHRPTDTPDKVNFEGMQAILNFSFDLVAALDEKGKLEFTETTTTSRQSIQRRGPVLGLMPDHAFEGEGLRIQAVTQGNPAQRAGIQDGDIIIRVGETRVSDIYTYMQALSTIGSAKSVVVRVVRNGKEMDVQVTF